MVFDAHNRAFAFFGGVPERMVYDNLKSVVETTGTTRFGHASVEVVRDNADIAATAGRFGHAAVEIVHDALPASSGSARFGQVAVEVIRSGAEVAVSGVGGGQVMVIWT